MTSFFQRLKAPSLICLGLICLALSAAAEDGSLSAADLAGKLAVAIEDGDSATRLRLKIAPVGGGEKTTLQVQVKARRTADKTDVVYQVLWPKERKGESFVIRQQRGGAPKGTAFRPPETMTTLDRSRMKDSVLGSDLSYQDLIENFFRWENQSLDGSEKLDRIDCVILESKPGAKDSSPYGKVRSWIDPRKMVAMRIEKFDTAGQLKLRIDTQRVIKDDKGRSLPASLMVRRPGGTTVTEIEGSNIRHDVKFSDRDFTTQALNDFKVPR